MSKSGKLLFLFISLAIISGTAIASYPAKDPVIINFKDAVTSGELQIVKDLREEIQNLTDEDLGEEIYDMTDELTSAAPAVDGVKTETVCFTAHNGADPVAVPITGTLFHRGAYKPNSNVIVAVHGFGSDQSLWDSSPFGNGSGGSFARALARAGYVVITYDQLGTGQSPYTHGSGAGFNITMDNQLAILREIITQIQNGSYTKTTTACSSGTQAKFGFKNLILIGHSAGAAIIESYAGLYHDVTAIIPMEFSNDGLSRALQNNFVSWVVPNAVSGHDYITVFPPNPNGSVSPECVNFFFYEPGANSKIYNRVCANQNLIPTPTGEFFTFNEFSFVKTHERIKSIGNLPVLMVFADHDRIFLGPKEANPPTDPDNQSSEIAYWKQNCGCDFSTFTQDNSGHLAMLHNSSPSTTRAIVDWLHSRGLAPYPRHNTRIQTSDLSIE